MLHLAKPIEGVAVKRAAVGLVAVETARNEIARLVVNVVGLIRRRRRIIRGQARGQSSLSKLVDLEKSGRSRAVCVNSEDRPLAAPRC